MGNLTVNHILISRERDIIYLCCKDTGGDIELFCIYKRKLAKQFIGGRWETVNSYYRRKLLRMVDNSIGQCPTIWSSSDSFADIFVN